MLSFAPQTIFKKPSAYARRPPQILGPGLGFQSRSIEIIMVIPAGFAAAPETAPKQHRRNKVLTSTRHAMTRAFS